MNPRDIACLKHTSSMIERMRKNNQTAIFFGYITEDIFIGLSSDFFADNNYFIHSC